MIPKPITMEDDIRIRQCFSRIRCASITQLVGGILALIGGIIIQVWYPGTEPTGIWTGVLVAINGVFGLCFCNETRRTTQSVNMSALGSISMFGVVGAMFGIHLRDLIFIVKFVDYLIPLLILVSIEILLSIILFVAVFIHVINMRRVIGARNNRQVTGRNIGSVPDYPTQAAVEVHPITSTSNYQPGGYVNPAGPTMNTYATPTNQDPTTAPAAPPSYQNYWQPQQNQTQYGFDSNPKNPVAIAPSQV